MTAGRLGLAADKADFLTMYLMADELIGAFNTAVRVRRGEFALDYTSHQPKLYVCMRGAEPELLAIIDTRRHATSVRRLNNRDLQLLVDDIADRLRRQRARLQFVEQQLPGKRRICKLQIACDDSRHIVATLAAQPKGTRRAGYGEIELTEAPLSTPQPEGC